MSSQKILLVMAVFISSGSLLVGIPIIGLNLQGEQLALATFAIMFNSLVGIFDIVRPAVTRILASEHEELSALWLVRTAACSGLFLSTLCYIGLYLASVPFMNRSDLVFFSLSIFAFCIVSGFWGALDARGFVGTAQLYRSAATSGFVVALVIQGHYGMSFSPSLALLISLIVLSAIMARHASSQCSLCKTAAGSITFSEFAYILMQNLAKLPIDFADRFAAAKILPFGEYALYGLIYEYISKVSIAPQLLSAYYYPKLCSKEVLAEYFFNFGFGICIVLNGIGWLLFFTFDVGFIALFDTSLTLSWLVPAMFCFFASHSLSFFGQTVGRSLGLQRGLALSFGIAAGIGGASLIIMLYFFGASAYILAISVAGFKSSYLYFAPFLIGKVAPKVVVISLFLCGFSLSSGVAMIILSGTT